MRCLSSNEHPKRHNPTSNFLRTNCQICAVNLQNERTHSLVTAATNGLDQKISIIDARLKTMTTELSHQLHELGTEIESLVKTADESASREALEQLRVNQIRIANEQARYEIAFRQDLAEVIEQIRKTK